MYNLLFIAGKLNYTDGVSSHVFNLISELKNNKDINLIILCTGGDSIKRFRDSEILILEDANFDHAKRSLKHFSSCIKKLIGIIRKNKINIIHSHNHYAANISYYASKYTGVKTIQTIHGLIPEGGFLKHFRAHKYITVNENIETFLIRNKIGNRNNIKFINQGFKFSERIIKKSQEEIKVICASRLVYEKGVDLFIKSVKIVKSKFKGNVKFLIAGNGEYETELKKLSKTINADVIFLGVVKSLPKLFSQTNIFVMPTRSTSEGFPMTIVEAALTRNLIITSQFNYFENFFSNNLDGFTFKVDDYKELSEKLLEALNNPERANQMAESFYNKSKNIFDVKKMTEKHVNIYRECQET